MERLLFLTASQQFHPLIVKLGPSLLRLLQKGPAIHYTSVAQTSSPTGWVSDPGSVPGPDTMWGLSVDVIRTPRSGHALA